MTKLNQYGARQTAIASVLTPCGIDLAEFDEPINEATWNDLQESRKALRSASNKISNRATSGSRANTEEEKAALSFISQSIAAIDQEIDTRVGNGNKGPRSIPGQQVSPTSQRPFANAPGAGGRNGPPKDGEPLRPGESFFDRVSAAAGGLEAPPFTLADMIIASATGKWSADMAPYRADMGVGSGPGGGFVTPGAFSAQIIDAARNQSRAVEAGISVIPATTGNLSFATVEKDPVPGYRAENTDLPESETVLGARNAFSHTIGVLVKMSIELAEDAVNINETVNNTIGQSIALAIDQGVFFGSGVGQPLGIYNHRKEPYAVNRIALNGPLTNYSPLSRAVEACRQNNVEPGDFVLSARTSGELDRLVDVDGNPLRAPRSVMERQMLSTNQISTDLEVDLGGSPPLTALNGSAIFNGLWSDYYLVVRNDVILEATRVAGDAFKKLQVWIRGYARVDGFAVRPKSFCVIDAIGPEPGE